MKILKFTYIPLLFFVVLLFSVPAQAATTTTSQSITINSGESISIRGQSYTNLLFDQEEAYYNDNDILCNTWTWNLSETISLTNFSTSKYYSGYIYIKLTLTPSNSDIQVSDFVLTSTQVTDGVYCYLGGIGTNFCSLAIVFDNYHPQRALMGIPTITCKAVNSSYSDNNMSGTTNFTLSLGSATTNLYGYEGVQNNALTAMIYSAVSQATAPELESILSMLTDIRNQDYTYYVQLTSQLASVLSNQTTELQRLQSIINELDTDFDDVQTILDLFPSYRTQVLEYWQQLLEMNAAQSEAAAEQSSQYAARDEQSATLLDGMNSVNMPELQADDLNILSEVDGTQKSNFFGLIGLITHTGIVTKIILTITLAAIVGYILYGKKG